MSGMTTISGVMSALCRLFKTGKREDLVDYGKERLIYQITVIWHFLASAIQGKMWKLCDISNDLYQIEWITDCPISI